MTIPRAASAKSQNYQCGVWYPDGDIRSISTLLQHAGPTEHSHELLRTLTPPLRGGGLPADVAIHAFSGSYAKGCYSKFSKNDRRRRMPSLSVSMDAA